MNTLRVQPRTIPDGKPTTCRFTALIRYLTPHRVLHRSAMPVGIALLLSLWLAMAPLFVVSPMVKGGHTTPGHPMKSVATASVVNTGSHHDSEPSTGAGDPNQARQAAAAPMHPECSVVTPVDTTSASCTFAIGTLSHAVQLPADPWQSTSPAPDPLPPRLV